MTPLLAIAALGAAAAAAAAAAGDASGVANVLPPGLKIALAHVPSWSHAYQVLTQHLQGSQQGSSGSTARAAGLIAAKKALTHGVTRAG